LNCQLYRPQQQHDDDDNDDDDDGDINNNEDDYKGGEGNDGFTADEAIKLFETNLIEKRKILEEY